MDREDLDMSRNAVIFKNIPRHSELIHWHTWEWITC